MQYGVYPRDMIVRFFYPLTCCRIVKHYLTSADSVLIIHLPKYGCTVPMFGSTYFVFLHQF